MRISERERILLDAASDAVRAELLKAFQAFQGDDDKDRNGVPIEEFGMLARFNTAARVETEHYRVFMPIEIYRKKV